MNSSFKRASFGSAAALRPSRQDRQFAGEGRESWFLTGTTAVGLVLACAGTAFAAESTTTLQLGPATVEDTALAQPYKAEKVESPKYTAPLLDTPQTVTVVPQQVIQDQNLQSLRDILTIVPGITFGAGEGGAGYGDSVTLRGFAASSDITQDGLRDSAQYSRSDAFNVQQVEIVNGANSVFSGSGSLGGSINLVSKTPQENTFRQIAGGVGSDNYFRGTADINERLSDNVAARLNVMGHKNDVPGRDVEYNRRFGVAPAVTFGLDTPTKITLMSFHQRDKNIPQYGVPYYRNQFNAGPLPGVDPSDYFGYKNVDKQKIEVDTFTAKIEHDFGDGFGIRNISRWQRVDQLSIVNPPQGTWCLANGLSPLTGAACTPVNSYIVGGPRGSVRDTSNEMLVNQTDFTGNVTTGPLRHNFVVGAMISRETFHLDGGNVFRNPNGTLPNPAFPNMVVNNPNNVWTGPYNYIQTASQDGEQGNQAVYAFDDLRIDQHFSINGGVRWEHNKGNYTSATYNTNGTFGTQTPLFQNEDNLFSYRIGMVYKPVEIGSFYVAYGNSKTPSKSSVNGSCTSGTFGTATFINNCNIKPESGRNYEIGTKWDILDRKLSLTAALFRNDRSNYKVPSNDPAVPDQQLDGKARVDGIALGASGQVTDEWAVFTNYTYLKSKVIQAVSDFCLRNPTNAACAPLLAGTATPIAGNPLTQVPEHAFNFWTTYKLPHDFQVGYGATYQGKLYLNNGAAPLFASAPYWVHKAMIGYTFDQITAQVNFSNIFNKEYYTRIRNNGWATVGDRRAVTLTVSYNF